MDLKLKHKVVIVTGGSNGIGQSCVESFFQEGAKVAIFDLKAPEESWYHSMAEKCYFLKVDLTDEEACSKAVQEIVQQWSRIDILVNNAGVNDGAGLEDSLAKFQTSLEKNLFHYFVMSKLCKPHLKNSKGSIINIGSKVSETGQGHNSGYVAAKGAVNGLTREWAFDLAKDSIRVNCVIPAETWTPQYERWATKQGISKEALQEIQNKIPFEHRFTQPEEIADMVTFLASEKSSHTTGQIIHVDGGYTHLRS